MREQRTWEAYGEEGKERYITLDTNKRMMGFRGCKEENLKEIILIEDPAGEYMGWIDKERDYPTLLRHKTFFPIQFPGGHEEKEAKGLGEAVTFRIEER